MTTTTTEKLYKRYDLQDESDFEIETLQQMREWLADFWENNPNEDMDDEDIEKLVEEIMASDEHEMFERLAGIDYSYYVLDEDGNEIVDEYEDLPISIEQNFVWGYGVEVREIDEKTLRVTVKRGEEKEKQVWTMELPETFEEVKKIFDEQSAIIRAEVQALNRKPEIKIIEEENNCECDDEDSRFNNDHGCCQWCFYIGKDSTMRV